MLRATRESVLDLLLDHKLEFVRQFLADHSIARSGTIAELRDRIGAALDSRSISVVDITRLLNHIEGWGDQQVYLFQPSRGASREWQSEDRIRAALDAKGLGDLLNATHPLLLPPTLTLTSVIWTTAQLRLVWVKRRDWEQRDADLDTQDKDKKIVWKAYHQRTSRAISAFDWDLTTGSAMLMLRSLPTSSNNYKPERDELFDAVNSIVDVQHLQPLNLKKAIANLDQSKEVRRRQLHHQTTRGGGARFTSSARSQDTNSDPDLEKSRRALGAASYIRMGNFYWLASNPNLSSELHTTISASEGRISIMGEHPEGAVRHVIGRIRHFSR